MYWLLPGNVDVKTSDTVARGGKLDDWINDIGNTTFPSTTKPAGVMEHYWMCGPLFVQRRGTWDRSNRPEVSNGWLPQLHNSITLTVWTILIARVNINYWTRHRKERWTWGKCRLVVVKSATSAYVSTKLFFFYSLFLTANHAYGVRHHEIWPYGNSVSSTQHVIHKWKK